MYYAHITNLSSAQSFREAVMQQKCTKEKSQGANSGLQMFRVVFSTISNILEVKFNDFWIHEYK